MPRSPFSRGSLHHGSVLPAQVQGHEQHNEENKPRPWLILSDPRIPIRAGLVLACPLTRTIREDERMAPFRMIIEDDMVVSSPTDAPFTGSSMLLGEQLRVMSLDRFQAPSRMGALKPAAMARVDALISRVLGLPG